MCLSSRASKLQRAKMLLQKMLPGTAKVCNWRGFFTVSSARLVCAAGRKVVDGFVGHDAALPADSLEVLQRKNGLLRSSLTSLRWPRLVSFQAYDTRFTVPWHGRGKLCTSDLTPPTQLQLAYLAGFFDGDGCVTTHGVNCKVQVGQSCDGAETLMDFQAAFGGVIGRLRDGLGLRKPSLLWHVDGHAAQYAACLLWPHSIVKRQQLQMVGEWPQQQAERVRWVTKLRSLKHYDSAVSRTPSWEYFTGFFDAEGHIMPVRAAGIRFSMSQKHVTVLQCLQRFLSCEMGIDAAIDEHSKQQLFTLRVTKASACKQILARMLECGMTRKADQAKLALGLTPSNSAEVHAAMAVLAGNQQYGRRLDQPGRHRAVEIHRLQSRERRARQLGQLQNAHALTEELRRRKCEHTLLKAHSENAQLQDHIRKVLSLHGA